MNDNDRIKIAVQKSGRLSRNSLKILNDCGIEISQEYDQLFCHINNFPGDLLRVRDDDIPRLIMSGICDFGIVGTNVLQEFLLQNPIFQSSCKIFRRLGFALCRLSIAVPNGFYYQDLSSLSNLRIATSYPNLLANYFEKNKVNAEIISLSGSVEIAPGLGMADAICDLVSTGATLKANNLREVESIFNSEAVLIQSVFLSDKKLPTAQIFQNRINNLSLGE
jgi:ATP phosphoribosyltransferase